MSFLPHKKFTWTDFGGIYTDIPPPPFLCPLCKHQPEQLCNRLKYILYTHISYHHHTISSKFAMVPRTHISHLITPSDVASRLRLHSANRHQLIIPRCRLNIYGRRAFSIAGPTVWNSLPDDLRDPACGSDSFKQFLKTNLFSLY